MGAGRLKRNMTPTAGSSSEATVSSGSTALFSPGLTSIGTEWLAAAVTMLASSQFVGAPIVQVRQVGVDVLLRVRRPHLERVRARLQVGEHHRVEALRNQASGSWVSRRHSYSMNCGGVMSLIAVMS